MLFKNTYIAFIFSLIFACNPSFEKKTLDASNSNLKLNNGVLYFSENPFSGNIVTYYEGKVLKSDIEYIEGKKHGYEKHWSSNTKLSNTKLLIERYYYKGKKVGVHKAWWNNGQPKFVYNFNDEGAYNGNIKEWYKTGQLFRDFNYKNGKELGSQRLWKINGSIKANYKVVNNERFGLIGLKKCYQVTVGEKEIK